MKTPVLAVAALATILSTGMIYADDTSSQGTSSGNAPMAAPNTAPNTAPDAAPMDNQSGTMNGSSSSMPDNNTPDSGSTGDSSDAQPPS